MSEDSATSQVNSEQSVILVPLSVESSTLSERAAEGIRAAIRSGELATGELYSVAKLAGTLGVSRTPVREALLVLERQGMVRFERNRGVRVTEMKLQDISDVFELRLLLEVPACRNACASSQRTEHIADVRDAFSAMRRAAELGDEIEFMIHDRRFHELILLASGNARLAETVGTLRDQMRQLAPSTVGRTRSLTEILAEHVAILDAFEAGDGDRTAHAMRDHIISTGALLVQQQGGTEDAGWMQWADTTATGSHSPSGLPPTQV